MKYVFIFFVAAMVVTTVIVFIYSDKKVENEEVISLKPGTKGDWDIEVAIPLVGTNDTVNATFTWNHKIQVDLGKSYYFGVNLKTPYKGWQYLSLPDDTIGKGQILVIRTGIVKEINEFVYNFHG